MRTFVRPISAVLAAAVVAGCGGVGTTPPFRRPHRIQVASPAFADHGPLPVQYTCAGAGQPPPLQWTRLPQHTVSVALVVVDEDAPRGDFVHWLVFNLPASTTGIATSLPPGARQARNSAGLVGWVPPCPPSGTHRYYFTVYAFRVRLSLPNGAATQTALRVLRLRAVGSGTIVGTVRA